MTDYPKDFYTRNDFNDDDRHDATVDVDDPDAVMAALEAMFGTTAQPQPAFTPQSSSWATFMAENPDHVYAMRAEDFELLGVEAILGFALGLQQAGEATITPAELFDLGLAYAEAHISDAGENADIWKRLSDLSFKMVALMVDGGHGNV